MSEWRTTTLGEFVALQRGHDLPQRERRSGAVPVVGSGGITGWHDTAIASGPGITIGRAANLGAPTFVECDFWPLNTTLYVTDFRGNDIRFTYYLFQTLDLTGFNSGSVQPMLNRNYIKRVPLRVPGLPEQQAIAAVLGVLDDKIALNDRIAATSLELADAHFFLMVRGLVPEGKAFVDVAQVHGGGTPKTSLDEYWGGKVLWATPTDVTALSAPYLYRTARTITSAGLDNCASQLYPEGSILMTSRATIGAFALARVPTAVNQGFIVVVPPTRELRWWLFHEMRSRVDEMIALANGSTFLELSRKNFKSMEVRIPSDGVLRTFADQVEPLHERAASAAEESWALATLRDVLLPGLMSGEIRVRGAEQVVEAAT